MAGDSDAGDVVGRIGERLIKQFTGLTGFKSGQEATWNEAPGGVALGFNLQRHNNKVEFDILVRDTSPDLEYIRDLVKAQTRIGIEAFVADNLDTYEVGQQVALGGERCVILPGEKRIGAGDAEDISFHVIGIGPIERFKEE